MHGTFYVTQAVGKRWITGEHRGSVISITVTWTRNGGPFVVPSAMSKSAIEAMTMSLAAEWGRYGIRLNAIAPGEIPTEGMSKRLSPARNPALRTGGGNPMGAIGPLEELQNLAAFLLSDGCDWLTGETIAMDGAQALATGGNFYELRDWGDAEWQARARRDRGAEREGQGGAGIGRVRRNARRFAPLPKRPAEARGLLGARIAPPEPVLSSQSGTKATGVPSLARALAIWGPGLLVMLADTDAGNVVTAADAGARFGYRLLPLTLFLAPALYLIQELTLRLGIATGRGRSGRRVGAPARAHRAAAPAGS